MPLSDSVLYTRHRKRNLASSGGLPYTSYLFDAVNGSGTTELLTPIEESWDRKNGWPAYEQMIKTIRNADQWAGLTDKSKILAYVRKLRMVDIGGPFYLKKEHIKSDGRIFDLYSSNSTYHRLRGYTGPLEANIITNTALRVGSGPFTNAYEASSEASLDAYGSTAISRCSPTNPHASTLTAVGELYRDGLPRIPLVQNSRSVIRNPASMASEELLNYEFAIRPTVNDVKKLANAASRSEEIVSQYLRDSGRLVRREYSFPTETTSETSVVTGRLPRGGTGATDTGLWAQFGNLRTTTTTTVDRWFSGGFTYYAGSDKNAIDKVKMQVRKWDDLYGIVPDAYALWNLTPWSWAADWMTNMGDVINNISMFSTDGLVMKYGYVMEHQVRTVEYQHYGGVYRQGSNLIPLVLTQVFKQETKRRRAATPFGFGLELDGFSARQWAILAALGITRSGSMAK